MIRLALFIFSFGFFSALADETVTWPQFRGPGGDGVANADDVPIQFGPGQNLKWRTPLPGRGWSSPVIDGDSIWLTTAVEVTAEEGEREKLLSEAGEPSKNFASRQIAKQVRFLALEVSLSEGKLKREIELTAVEKPDSIHLQNSYASPTPFLEKGRLYAHFGTFGTFCVDTASGEVLWKRQLKLEHNVGPGSSPFIYKDLLILICDGVDLQYVAALNKLTGETVWKTDRPAMRAASGDQKKAYCTPIVVTPKDGTDQLICMGSQWLVSYDPLTGKENWALDHGNGFSVVPRPVFSEKEQLIYISTGFGKPELWAVNTRGEAIWKEPHRIPARPSPLLAGDEIYVITDGGIATCLRAKDGQVLWSERVGGNFSASPLLAGGHIYLCNHEGKVAVLKPGSTYQLVAENDLGGEQLMASPVALDGRLIVRSAAALYCFGLEGKDQP